MQNVYAERIYRTVVHNYRLIVRVRSSSRGPQSQSSDPALSFVYPSLSLSHSYLLHSPNPPAEFPLFRFSLSFLSPPPVNQLFRPPNRTLQFVPSCLALLSAFSPLHPLTGVAYASAPLGLSAVGCQSFQY